MNRSSTAWRWQAVVMVAAVVAGSSLVGAVKGKFYPDDPLTIDPEERDASRVQPQEIDHVYGGWQMIRGVGDHAPRRALNVNSMDDDIMLAQEVAGWLKVSLITVRKWTSSGFIPCIRFSRAVRYNRREIESWLLKRSLAGRAKRIPEVILSVK